MRRFELIEGTSSKFWEIALSGSTFTVRFGRIGTSGQTQEKSFPTEEKARTEHDKLVAEKTKKGYAEVGGAPAAVASATTTAAPSGASPAPAKPKPAPKKAKAEVEVAAVEAAVEAIVDAPRPAATVKRAPTASAIVATDVATWPAEIRAELLPSREHPGPAISLDRAAIWKKIRERVAAPKDAAHVGAEIEKARELAASTDPPASLADADIEHALAALISQAPQFYKETRWVIGGVDLAIDHWVATGGVASALDLVYRWFHKKSKVTQWAANAIWLRLAAHLAHASADDRAAALAVAKKLDPAEKEGGFAYLFPETGAANRMVLGASQSAAFSLLVLAITDLAALEQVAQQAYPSALNIGTTYTDRAVEPVAFELVARFGAGVIEPFMKLAAHQYAGADENRGLARAIALVSTDAAFEALATRLADKPFIAAMREGAARTPALALGPLAAAATGRGATATTARTILGLIVRTESADFAAAEATLTPAQAKVVAELRAKGGGDREEASLDELPRVLAKPPWLEKKRGADLKVVNVAPIELATTMRWPAGVRESWAQYREPDWAAQVLTDPSWMERCLQINPAEYAELERGDLTSLGVIRARTGYVSAHVFSVLPPVVANSLLLVTTTMRFYGEEQAIRKLASLHELAVFEGLLEYTRGHMVEGLQVLRPYGSPRIAPLAAVALVRQKKAVSVARAWLHAHPREAAVGIIPVAIGPKGKDRETFEIALRMLAREGFEDAIVVAAKEYGDAAVEAVRAVLDFDARDIVPAKLPKLPDFIALNALPRLVLKTGKAIPASAMAHVLTMLSISRADVPYEGVRDLVEVCTRESLAELGWDLFQAWLVAGAPSKEGWAFTQLGFFGDDECARKLTALVRVWPGEAAHARAVTGLEILATIGTDVALMHLHGIAQKLKFKGLQEKAREKIDQIAEARGLTAEELADRLVPDLGLEDDGSLELDFGARKFKVAFDEVLKPFVKDASNARLADLPKPKKDDDAEKSTAAVETWKALKKDAKTIASQQVFRLEMSMCTRRRWTHEVFRRFIVEHPLLRHLAVRVVWGTYRDGDDGALDTLFRIAEDGSFADAEDNGWTLPEGATVGVAHALEMPKDQAARFGQVFGDYEILQPFKQLGREVYALTDDEKAAKTYARCKDRVVETTRVLGLESRGWRRGPVEDGGVLHSFDRDVRLLNGKEAMVSLEFFDGIIAGAATEWKEQKLHGLGFGYDWRYRQADAQASLGEIDPVMMSELIRDIEMLSA